MVLAPEYDQKLFLRPLTSLKNLTSRYGTNAALIIKSDIV